MINTIIIIKSLKFFIYQMTEWRKARQATSKVRQARLEEKKRKEREEIPPSPPSPLPAERTKQPPVNAAPAPETTILTPQPLSPPTNELQDDVKANGLDFADFDNDTSSPFDNMELKTINDMEELAQVREMLLFSRQTYAVIIGRLRRSTR